MVGATIIGGETTPEHDGISDRPRGNPRLASRRLLSAFAGQTAVPAVHAANPAIVVGGFALHAFFRQSGATLFASTRARSSALHDHHDHYHDVLWDGRITPPKGDSRAPKVASLCGS